LNVVNRIADGKLSASIEVVIASRQCKGVEIGREHGLNVHLVPYKQTAGAADPQPPKAVLPSGKAVPPSYSTQITQLLDAAKVDLVLMAGFLSHWWIPPQYANKVINIHPALLPSFGGKGMFGHHVHKAVLEHGCKVSGCTVHFVTNEYDRGPIIIQRCVPVLEDDTPETLAARVFEQELIAFPQAIELFAQGRLEIDGCRVKINL
jgi:formyltetrahydrofolate-dependent phosphoribosylglycinamide formyltransferase